MSNLEWIKTLTHKQFVNWLYGFWWKEQNKFTSSPDGLEWWLQQERQEQDFNKRNDYTTPLEPVKPREHKRVEVVTWEEQENE